jgi:hypothetical protein
LCSNSPIVQVKGKQSLRQPLALRELFIDNEGLPGHRDDRNPAVALASVTCVPNVSTTKREDNSPSLYASLSGC